MSAAFPSPGHQLTKPGGGGIQAAGVNSACIDWASIDVSNIASITASDIAIENFCFIVLLLYQLSSFW
jgi:hypothetical protein